ncbi:MAG: hypothetical protein EVA89_20340 [Sandaracinaceae bacterium]|nr:MAG: hypothetical protein EVA89_20340 [Sandaracinaceae bacterium]
MTKYWSWLGALLWLAACGSDPDPAVDAARADGSSPPPIDASSRVDGGPDGGTATDSGVAAVGEWTLPMTARVGGKLPMYALYPRPDAETSSDAYHRHAHPRVPYRVRIAVQGGEWPFRYELLEGPEGAGFVAGELARREDPERGWIEHLRTPGYGVLEWAAPEDGSHAVRVRVTDQSGDSVELSWTVTTDAAAFVFVDSEGGDDGAPGTFERPLRTFAGGLWRNDGDDATWAGRIAVFREGRYAVYATAPFTSPVLDGRVKPAALVGHPGESVTFDLTEGHFRTSRMGGLDDILIAGIDFVGSRDDLGNARLFNVTDRSQRVTFWECSFDETGVGGSGRDNPACIAFMADGPYHENLAVLDCELRPNASSQLVVTFDSNHVLFEGNRAIGVDLAPSNGDTFLHPKDDTNNLTVRDNVFVGRAATAAIDVSNQITEGAAENQEVCWNTIVYDGDQNVDCAIRMNGQTTTPDASNSHVYRNSVVSQRRAFLFRGAEMPIPVTVEGNAFFGAEGGLVGGNYVEGPVPNISLMETDFDGAGALIGAARETHGGLAGAEVIAPR